MAPGGSQAGGAFAQCKTGADASKNDECLVIATVNSAPAYWASALPQYGRQYTKANTVLYSGQTQSACGTASNQVGPSTVPSTSWSTSTPASSRSSSGSARTAAPSPRSTSWPTSTHHVQDILGLLGRAQQDPQGPESGAVRLELMADCMAGMWVKNATQTKDANGTTFLKPITEEDIQSALSAASAVGDDRISEPPRDGSTPSRGPTGRARSGRSGSPRVPDRRPEPVQHLRGAGSLGRVVARRGVGGVRSPHAAEGLRR